MKFAGQSPSRARLTVALLRAEARENPRLLVLAAVAQALQALLLLGLGVATCVAGLTSDSHDLLNSELVGLLALAGGAALLAVARGLLGARAWSRSPALVWQLIAIPIAFSTTDDLPAVAYPLLVSAGLVVVGLFAPSSATAMAGAPDPSDPSGPSETPGPSGAAR